MFVIAILGITLSTVGVVWSTQAKREKEVQLLWVGQQYRLGIARYRARDGQFPPTLADLVDDKRDPVARRYLRQRYPDPMTGSADWQLIPAPDGGILGVASRSQEKPVKVAGFSIEDAAFEKSECYCDWKFVYSLRYGIARHRTRSR